MSNIEDSLIGRTVIFSDGHSIQIAPITYDEFVEIDDWDCSSDIAWGDFLRDNGFDCIDIRRFKELLH